MFKSLKLYFVSLFSLFTISMPAAHALPMDDLSDSMHEAICDFYREIGLPEDNIIGSANVFVSLLTNRNSDDFQNLQPYQVRNLVHSDRNDLSDSVRDQLIVLAIDATREYGLILYSQGLLPSVN